MTTEKENFLVRDVFNSALVEKLANDIENVYPTFSKESFIETCLLGFPTSSFKERIQAITKALGQYLPSDYTSALDILLNSLIPEIEGDELIGIDATRFVILPLTAFVSTYGIDHFEPSVQALYEMTKRFSAEYDIRYFIDKYPDQMLPILTKWTQDPNCHVRRLVSEGTRPRLPWGMRLARFIQHPAQVITLLSLLKNDPKQLVQRSIANNLNDIAKDHPVLVIDTLTHWQNNEKPIPIWTVKHALRTLLKQGNPKALALLGINTSAAIQLQKFNLKSSSINLGSKLEISAEIINLDTKPSMVAVDFVVYYLKANGTLSPKTFKWKQMTLQPNETATLYKEHLFANFSTRKHHFGAHQIAVQINGMINPTLEFKLHP